MYFLLYVLFIDKCNECLFSFVFFSSQYLWMMKMVETFQILKKNKLTFMVAIEFYTIFLFNEMDYY